MQVMKEREATKPLAGWIQLDDAFWGGRRRGKRGRGARGKTPLVAAAATDEQGNPQRLRLTRVRGFRLREIARWSQLHLTPGSHVCSDGRGDHLTPGVPFTASFDICDGSSACRSRKSRPSITLTCTSELSALL